ncbi:hypothetical protein ACH4S8_28945 [Streptomyces sp. NPDC021080]|uniref:hypothetical protein n=1 Tax=Streptomyces sp. NPDC021080 TaxID=3365110 RepID=UPI0037B00A83
MTQHDERYDDDTFAPDFAGAGRLVAAGRVPPPEPAVVRAALTAVRVAATEETRTARAATAEDTRTARAIAEEEGRARSTAAVQGPVRTPEPRPVLNRRRMLLAAGGVAAAAAGAVLLPRAGSGERREHTTTAPEFLQQVAYVAAGGAGSTAPYWRVDAMMTSGPPPKAARLHSQHPDGETRHSVTWLSRTGMILKTAAGGVSEYPTDMMSWDIAEKDITWDDLRTLPTTPAALRTRLLGSRPKRSTWVALFNGADSLLAGAPSGPGVRAALYELLAEIPGIRLHGMTRDSIGRAGTAVELNDHERRSRLVIDPKSALLLEGAVYQRGGKEDGRIVSRVTYLSVGAARTAPEGTGTPQRHA